GREPPPTPRYHAAAAWSVTNTAARRTLAGGARGTVHGTKQEPLEGIMVQLISTSSGIRSTVYSDVDGRYEFPTLEPGTYTLRIARPLEFKPYVWESVRIEGATSLADIFLDRVTDMDVLPTTPEIL